MTTPDRDAGSEPPPKPCPICGKPSRPEHRPFCSRRCADVDLNRWLSGRYAVPAEPVDEGEDDRDGHGGEP